MCQVCQYDMINIMKQYESFTHLWVYEKPTNQTIRLQKQNNAKNLIHKETKTQQINRYQL